MPSNETAIATPKADDRVHQVYMWILSGASQHDIEQAIEATWPGTKSRPLIVEGMKRIARAADADPNVLRGWCIDATREIYRRAMEVADHQTALRALKQMMELASANV